MQNQINCFMSNSFSPYLCGYTKGYKIQQVSLVLTEKWKKNR